MSSLSFTNSRGDSCQKFWTFFSLLLVALLEVFRVHTFRCFPLRRSILVLLLCCTQPRAFEPVWMIAIFTLSVCLYSGLEGKRLYHIDSLPLSVLPPRQFLPALAEIGRSGV